MNAQSTVASPAPAENPQPEGRPRVLNDSKRSEILELISDGLDLQQAARHVRCSIRTIRREMKRDPGFGSEVRRSEKFAQVNPLQAMQRAVHHNWRAAAWLLERMFPERFAKRPAASAIGAKQARQLLNDVLEIVNAEIHDTGQRGRIDARIRAAFEYRIQVYCARKRSSAGLRRATEWFEKKDQSTDLPADFGPLTPDLDAIRNLLGTPTKANFSRAPKSDSSKRRAASPRQSPTMTEVLQDFIDQQNAEPRSPLPPNVKTVSPPQATTSCVTPNVQPEDKTTRTAVLPAPKTAANSREKRKTAAGHSPSFVHEKTNSTPPDKTQKANAQTSTLRKGQGEGDPPRGNHPHPDLRTNTKNE